jgi:hypothetical protein
LQCLIVKKDISNFSPGVVPGVFQSPVDTFNDLLTLLASIKVKEGQYFTSLCLRQRALLLLVYCIYPIMHILSIYQSPEELLLVIVALKPYMDTEGPTSAIGQDQRQGKSIRFGALRDHTIEIVDYQDTFMD